MVLTTGGESKGSPFPTTESNMSKPHVPTKMDTMIARVREHFAREGKEWLIEWMTDNDLEEWIGEASSSPWAIVAVEKRLKEGEA